MYIVKNGIWKESKYFPNRNQSGQKNDKKRGDLGNINLEK